MSAPSRKERAEAARWLGGAEEELVVARLLAGHPEAPARAACFHAHLAAEKALKALLIARGVLLTKTHDLDGLAMALPARDRVRLTAADLKTLAPWTIEGRYPANLADTAASHVRAVVEAAEHVLEAVRESFAEAIREVAAEEEAEEE